MSVVFITYVVFFVSNIKRGDGFIKKCILIIVLIFSVTGVVYSGYSIYVQINQYQQSQNKYDELKEIYQTSSVSEVNRNHKNLTQINEDYVGWLRINNTKVSYPVVKGEDNEFYLTHNFSREQDFAGSIFMDSQNTNDGLDKHTIVYGHNMKDNSMFGDLEKYLEQEYYQDHTLISFDNPTDTYEWEIFSVYTSRDGDWLKTDLEKTNSFAEYLNDIKNKSIISNQTEVSEEDRFLTLATCTNRDIDERIVVHARLITKGEKYVNEN
ncbi:class B sortase [Aquibacillus rhizosphaerae]|uniref:Class B sortase n=1 Tax=Aquibacillus rhizosphaerae TaxID=3051431 RepID=A0ABT7L2U2_9BACI|nr:class B sortase [Aquibacillus sp. LR5S19]MDL4838926.1 class B sortase [Aquibacillus sp. LR5S19]